MFERLKLRFERCMYARSRRSLIKKMDKGLETNLYDFTDYLCAKEEYLRALANTYDSDEKKREFYNRKADKAYRSKMRYITWYFDNKTRDVKD